ncbi:HEAT repeat domain-containing protein [Halosimplex sp. J119]
MDVEPLVVRCRGESVEFDAVRAVFAEAGLTPDESVTWRPGRDRFLSERHPALGRVRAVLPEADGHDLRLRADPLTRIDWLRAVTLFERAFDAGGLAWGTSRPGYRPRGPDERTVTATDPHTVGAVAYFDSETVDRIDRETLTAAPALAIREDNDGRVTLVSALSTDSDRIEPVQSAIRGAGRTPSRQSIGTYSDYNDREPGYTRPSFEEGPVQFSAPASEASGGPVALLDHLGIWDREDVREGLWDDSERTVDALATVLDDEREVVRREATWALWYGARGNADVDVASHLARRLDDESASVRALAVDGLRRAGKASDPVDSDAIALVRSMALDSDDVDLQITAIRSLGTLAGETHASAAVDTYRDVFEDSSDRTVREATVAAAADFADEDHVPYALDLLFDALVDGDPDVRKTAAGEFPTPPKGKSYGSIGRRKRDGLFDAVERHESTVHRALEDEDPSVRAIGVRLAVGFLDERAIEALNRASTDPSPEVRRAVARAVSLIAPPTSTDSLANMLADESALVRRSAARLLADYAEHKPQTVTPHLDAVVDALGDDEDVDRWLVEVLEQLGTPESIEVLVDLLGDDRQSVRRRAVGALRDAGDVRALDRLRELADATPDRATRNMAREAIRAIERRSP